MNIVNIILILLFVLIIIKQIKYVRELIIPTKKSYGEIIAMLFSTIVLIYIIYFYAHNWIHYILGILGIFMLISMWLKQGITSEGFVIMNRGKELIQWDKITKVTMVSSKHLKLTLTCEFLTQTFSFKNSDYDKILNILKENLPIEATLEIL